MVASREKSTTAVQRGFTRRLILVFSILLVASLTYSWMLVLRTRDALTSLQAHHGDALMTVIKLRSVSDSAVQEAFACLLYTSDAADE